MDNRLIRILIVDDDEDDYILTKDSLDEIEHGNFLVEWAATYNEALSQIREKEYDIYFFDYRLGEKNGLDLLEEARNNGLEKPIILLTGQGDRMVDIEAMKRGASDYLAKGAFDAKLLERTIRYTIEHAQTLAELRNSQQSLQTANNQLEEAANIINEEMEMARLIQRSMLPDLKNITGLKIAASYNPCQAIGGDLYDLIEIDNNKIALFVFDVVGHGVPAALVSAMAKISFSRNINKENTPGDVLKAVNIEINENLREQMNLTAFLGILDKTNREFIFSRAGHPPAIILRSKEHTIESLNIKGISIGFIPDAEYELEKVTLNNGDKIVFYTDGITECINEERKRFGIRRLEELLLRMTSGSATEIVDELKRDYKNFMGKAPQIDDITLMVTEFV